MNQDTLPAATTGYQAREVRRVTVGGLIVNVVLSALKFAVGVLSGSQALVADAVHSLSDMVTDVAVLVGVRYWSIPADEDHPYGHGRIETLVSLFIGVALGTVGVGLGYRAVDTLRTLDGGTPGWIAFAAAGVSIIAKEILYRWTIRVGKRVKSSAMVANAWHHRSDAMSSLPVAIAVLATRIWPSLIFLDHIATVIVAVLILQAAWRIVWPTLRELIDAGAVQADREAILAFALATPGVQAVHALRTRHVGSGLLVDLHVLVSPGLTVREGHAIAGLVEARLRADATDVIDVLVHVEPNEPAPGRPGPRGITE